MSYRLGVDIGGTFTDFALLNVETGAMAIHKQLTTPRDPSVSVIEGATALLARESVPISSLESVVHGTTLVTNAVIERKGAKLGMLTTSGFRDVLQIGRERRYDLFDLHLRFPSPLVPRDRIMQLDERIRYDGTILHPLNHDEVRRSTDELIRRHDIEAVAICFLHSYANPAHEEGVHELLSKEYPKIFVSRSAEVFPYMREYERWTTTTINAYAQPMVDRYLDRLENELEALGFCGSLHIMASNGGTIAPDTARRFPVRMLESGPAAGVLMSAYLGGALNRPDILSFDMGGTTAKGAVVRESQPLKTYELEIGRMHEFKRGSGLPVRVPVIDMIEIGAGGGSIAEVDDRGLIRVGPASAGAEPGPACYGRGGDLPTLTDADLVLGYLDPDFFLGGAMALDQASSERVIAKTVGEPLDLDLSRAAWGIHEVINEDVARAFRVHASERGIDYRSCTMIGFGGSGPVHALRIARKLKVPRVVLPVGAGVMSAFGLLVSPRSFEIVQTRQTLLLDLTLESFDANFRPLEQETSTYLRAAGVPEGDIHIVRRLDMRYCGQGYDIEVTLPDMSGGLLIPKLSALFAEAYERVFSISFLDQPIEIINWKVEARGPVPEVDIEFLLDQGCAPRKKGRRPAYFPEKGGYVDCPVYDRYLLKPGQVLQGPALIEENESTCVVGIGDLIGVDHSYNLVAEIAMYGATR